ncbi:hypothetical protein [Enhygromyxa salina]|uniref:hypothetical protein n=1 Tax=Enhygromyxa salina TaxID=215803 RepID=UPI0015E62170|nr:hypothetical protein [Enhygromyxa salina]
MTSPDEQLRGVPADEGGEEDTPCVEDDCPPIAPLLEGECDNWMECENVDDVCQWVFYEECVEPDPEPEPEPEPDPDRERPCETEHQDAPV